MKLQTIFLTALLIYPNFVLAADIPCTEQLRAINDLAVGQSFKINREIPVKSGESWVGFSDGGSMFGGVGAALSYTQKEKLYCSLNFIDYSSYSPFVPSISLEAGATARIAEIRQNMCWDAKLGADIDVMLDVSGKVETMGIAQTKILPVRLYCSTTRGMSSASYSLQILKDAFGNALKPVQ